MCLEGTSNFGALMSYFMSKIGIWDPHYAVFHLSGESTSIHVCRPLIYIMVEKELEAFAELDMFYRISGGFTRSYVMITLQEHKCWSLEGTSNFGALMSYFMSKIGILDPHHAFLHLSGESTSIHVCRPLIYTMVEKVLTMLRDPDLLRTRSIC